jgi:LPXTG-site transpeptidase (sortase) family protein
MTPPRKAIIDSEGNIVLPSDTAVSRVRAIEIEPEETEGEVENIMEREDEPVMDLPSMRITDPEEMWTVIDDDIDVQNLEHAALAAKRLEQAKAVWSSVRNNVYTVTGDVLQESARQYQSSLIDGTVAGKDAARSLRGNAKRFWIFLKQPVWIPNKQKQPVQYSRGTLFLLDTVRFGGTFAVLFGVLFAAMNFQSFSTIAFSYIEPLAQVTGIVQAHDSDDQIAEKLKTVDSHNETSDGQNAQFLPPVGPPENRLVIPKLNLNVPIVIPPMDALIAEDWKKLEEEIQAGLHDGVVHYPGTARPGKPGNFFLTGHSSYFPWDDGKYKSVFARLGELKTGDEYWVFYNGDKYRYIVQNKKEIKPSDVTVLDQPIDERISTLMTCTPIGTTLRRLIISAQEVDPVTGKPLEVGEHANEEMPKVKMDMLPI